MKAERCFYRIRTIRKRDPQNIKSPHTGMCYKVPVVTVCLIRDEEGNVAKGLSICSKLDSFDTRKGKLIAEQRAMKALKDKNSGSPIAYHKAWDNLVGIVYKLDLLPPEDSADPPYKSRFNPALSEFDEKSLRTTSEEIDI